MCNDERSEPKEGCKPSDPEDGCELSESKGCYKLPGGGRIKFCQWPLLRPLKLTTGKLCLLDACKRRLWKLADDWCVVLCDTNRVSSCDGSPLDGEIVIPKGTIIDGASVPLPWLVSFLTFGILRPTGILLIPSIVHDYAYDHGCLRYRNEDGTETCREISRDDADWLFRVMIRGINHTRVWACVAWLAVRIGWLFCVKYNDKPRGGKPPYGVLVGVLVALPVLVAVLYCVGFLWCLTNYAFVAMNAIIGIFSGRSDDPRKPDRARCGCDGSA